MRLEVPRIQSRSVWWINKYIKITCSQINSYHGYSRPITADSRLNHADSRPSSNQYQLKFVGGLFGDYEIFWKLIFRVRVISAGTMCLQVAGPCVVVVPASPGLLVVVVVVGPAVVVVVVGPAVVVVVVGPALVVVVVGPAVVVVVVDVVEAGGQRRKSLRPPVHDPTLTLENLESPTPNTNWNKLQPHNLSSWCVLKLQTQDLKFWG